jgi:predicted nucleotidyltransferase component of viral defense system
MIHPDSRSREWLQQVAEDNNFTNIPLIEKAIRAFSLLESLVRSGCPFVFKGGTALMLHLNSSKRISIDIDIICPPDTNIEIYLSKYAEEYGFTDIKLIGRKHAHSVPKGHAKFFYQVAYATNADTEYILLDVLFEEIHYNQIDKLPIVSRFLKTEGDPVFVNTPSIADLLGDKLTAFAPNTTGIPYFKGDKSCSMEIIKQLFDIASLFDVIEDLLVVATTFRCFAGIELAYRNFNINDISSVLDDIYHTSLCICLQGLNDKGNFTQLQDGIKKVQNFIHSGRYNLEKAITDASKTAYLATLLKHNIMTVDKYDANINMRDWGISESLLNTKLNKLKKTNTEAFYYWYKIYEIYCRFVNHI